VLVMASKEVREGIAQRGKELFEEKATAETDFVRGKWITDNNALQNPVVRRHERFQRKAPKRLVEANMMKIEDDSKGLELDDGEVADRVTQGDIISAVDTQTQHKKFELVLDKLGPYKIDFSTNGTHLCLAGLRGHLANLKWKDFSLVGETQLKDKINDVKFLVDHSMIAVAQKRFVYMYTKEGVEMHILSKMAHMDRLAYLPRHMLLAAASTTYSNMQYIDISTGEEIGSKPPVVMKNPTSAMSVNPANGVVATCDLRGVVKLWSPTVVDPLVQLKAHSGAIHDIAFHHNGRFFATLGGDHKMKLWDCRMLRTLEEFAVTYCFDSIDISSKGLVAMGGGTNIQIWKNMFTGSKPSAPLMKFGLGYGNIATQVKFCPFEDVLGVGHSKGFTSLLVPASGEANPDFYFADPHETEVHRKERVVSGLLDKLPADTISLDLQIGTVNIERLEEYNKNLQASRRQKGIREKKQRRADKSQGQHAPTGVANIGNDDEVDEELGFKEKAPVRELKSKQDLQKERKMKRWDQKDSADKVRSKQVMRHSKLTQRRRQQRDRSDGNTEESVEPVEKKKRVDLGGDPKMAQNAALRRLMR
jgi:U3 small nucleolar RNA-associated protein 7